MAIEAIDHLYIECRSFKDSVAFWESLGFRLVEEWGEDGHQAGRLEAGSAAIVLAESDTPTVDIHFRDSDADNLDASLAADDRVVVAQALEPTHWGTRWMRVKDPEGRPFVLEETGKG